MKKKRTKWIIALIVAVFLLVAGIIFASIAPMLQMTPLETQTIPNTNIIAVRNNINNMFFIPSTEGYIVIDAGTDASAIQEAIKALSIDEQDITAILLTHTDYDHVGSLSIFPNASIYLSENEAQMIDGTTARNMGRGNSLPAITGQGNIVYLNFLEDRKELVFSEYQITCHETPGHTPGSMSYLINETYLFTGDAVKVKDNIMSVHPFSMDKETAEASIQLIEEIKVRSQYVLTAHYGYYLSEELSLEK